MTKAEAFAGSRVTASAAAKVNLTLHVTGQRADGYHLLDSLVAFAEVGDRLELQPGPQLCLDITGPFAAGVPNDAQNLVWRAAEALGWRGKIALQKNLPHGAGIGGGSSDAAAILRVLREQGARLPEGLALSLGADVPVCLQACAARMQGIGEQISAVRLPKLPALLVNPGVHVPTAAVFKGLETRDNPPMPRAIPEFSDPQSCAAWLAEQRNDLEPPARAVTPVIDRVLGDLAATRGALMTRMSGSGATCFALYPSMKAAHFAAYELGAEHTDWWCVATELT